MSRRALALFGAYRKIERAEFPRQEQVAETYWVRAVELRELKRGEDLSDALSIAFAEVCPHLPGEHLINTEWAEELSP